MDMSDLLKMGADTFMKSNMSGDAGSGLSMDSLTSALSGLTGGGEEGGFDLSSLLGKMQGGEMLEMAQSWLGDGDNAPVEGSQITEMFGSDKISEFASKLGISEEEAVGGLQDALPQIVDQASSGGSMLDSIGGVSGALSMAGKLFGR